jgi:hypothetical protein
MPPDRDPEALRARARRLRRLAAQLQRSTIYELRRLAGDDTWRGPTADAFMLDATWAQRTLDTATTELVAAARLLERQAADAA